MSELHEAAERGDAEAVKALIAAGTDVNAKDKYGIPALMWAALKRHTETVKTLIEAGADVEAKTNNGRTALLCMALAGHTVSVESLIQAGADVNAQDNGGGTALMWAADWGHTKIVKTLIEAGADVNVKDKDGKTALAYASKRGYTKIVDLLKQHKGIKMSDTNTDLVDMVNKPPHYLKGDVECISAIEAAVVGLPPQEAVSVAALMNYVWRYNDKGTPAQDLKKAQWYLARLIGLVDKR